MLNNIVTKVSIVYNVALITVTHLPKDIRIISDIFTKIAEQDINIDIINQSPPYRDRIDISFTVASENLIKSIGTLNAFKKDIPELQVEVDADNTKLIVSGEKMKNIPGVAAKLFSVLANTDVEIKLITTSETDISYLIYEKDVDIAVDAIKREFNI